MTCRQILAEMDHLTGLLCVAFFVIHGAGAGGVGVAWAIREGLVRAGLSRADAQSRVFVLDSRGLLLKDRDMEDYKKEFAHERAAIERARLSIQDARAKALYQTRGSQPWPVCGRFL